LIVFFIVVVLVIPYQFYAYFSREERDVGGVSTENRKIFNELIDENITGVYIAGILG